MSFGDELKKISEENDLVQKTWQMIKYHLLNIASDRGAKGCHIFFEGVDGQFIKELIKAIKTEEIKMFVLQEELLHLNVYWGEVEVKNERNYYYNMSDNIVYVSMRDGTLNVEVQKIGSRRMSWYCISYIS